MHKKINRYNLINHRLNLEHYVGTYTKVGGVTYCILYDCDFTTVRQEITNDVIRYIVCNNNDSLSISNVNHCTDSYLITAGIPYNCIKYYNQNKKQSNFNIIYIYTSIF